MTRPPFPLSPIAVAARIACARLARNFLSRSYLDGAKRIVSQPSTKGN